MPEDGRTVSTHGLLAGCASGCDLHCPVGRTPAKITDKKRGRRVGREGAWRVSAEGGDRAEVPSRALEMRDGHIHLSLPVPTNGRIGEACGGGTTPERGLVLQEEAEATKSLRVEHAWWSTSCGHMWFLGSYLASLWRVLYSVAGAPLASSMCLACPMESSQLMVFAKGLKMMQESTCKERRG